MSFFLLRPPGAGVVLLVINSVLSHHGHWNGSLRGSITFIRSRLTPVSLCNDKVMIVSKHDSITTSLTKTFVSYLGSLLTSDEQ